MFDMDEAAMLEGEGAQETERAREKMGPQGGRTAGAGGAAEVVEAGVHWVRVRVLELFDTNVDLRFRTQYDCL